MWNKLVLDKFPSESVDCLEEAVAAELKLNVIISLRKRSTQINMLNHSVIHLRCTCSTPLLNNGTFSTYYRN